MRRSAGRASSSKLTSELTGLPGSPKIGVLVEPTERERLGRFDRDLHPGHVGDPTEHRLHDVVVAHRHSAARHDGITVGRCGTEHAFQLRLVVTHDPEVDNVAPGLGEQGGEHRLVALANLSDRQRRTVVDQFVTGRQHGNPCASVHLDAAQH